ncbi:MAG: protein-glutamate O-methyltransferase CheR [Sphingomonas sp.]|uniref:CheR family methyltransferase n=1 Tax=Sphingomonas sp. TaxID=28214 RepID=UPI0025CC0EBB|nr:protein-glutamate O-methyltransferase CheR [Sphingomonas sp.]MBY0282362.1 protein-glutamate O-methyltransferase CheR [Sphingomonas sp.]
MNALAEAFEKLPGIGKGVYAPADFEAVRKIVHQTAGIVLVPGKAMLVYSRLAPLVRNTGCGTFAAYVKRIEADDAERRRAICALTTNHTFFFREDHHFDHLGKSVRPGLLKRASAGDPVRIWSAGCSSGEETWSILMTMLGTDRGAAGRLSAADFLLLATDLADHALATAEAAQYRCDTLDAVPGELRRAWMREADGQATVADEARALVRFKSLNLLGDWPMARAFDVIFCRNVMIYFDHATKERLVDRFARQLAPGGHLYIGHSERVTGPAERVLTQVGPTIYRKDAA